jgi:hypothetical protein
MDVSNGPAKIQWVVTEKTLLFIGGHNNCLWGIKSNTNVTYLPTAAGARYSRREFRESPLMG